MLVIAASFGATATFTADGDMTLTLLADADDDTRTAAVQRLVDVGMGVKESMCLLSNPPPPGQASWSARTASWRVGTELRAHDMTEPLTRH